MADIGTSRSEASTSANDWLALFQLWKPGRSLREPLRQRQLFPRTGLSPLQFVTRERITRAQQMMRESKRNLIEIALEVGYTSPSAFAQVFRRIAGVTPTEFREVLIM